VYSITEQADESINATIRSALQFKVEASTCIGSTGQEVLVLFDAPNPIGDVAPEFISTFASQSGALVEAWPGFPENDDDTRFAFALLPCPESDRSPQRLYCRPSCDFPGAEAGRTCDFPTFTSAFPECHAGIENTAPAVEQINVAENLPIGVGGTPSDGSYQLTASKIYTGPGGASGATGQLTSVAGELTGDSVQLSIGSGSPGNQTQVDYTLLTSADQVIVTQTCPAYDGEPFDTFTAIGDQLTLYDTLGKRALEFTRLP